MAQITGWCLSHPSEKKYESVGMTLPNKWNKKNSHVPVTTNQLFGVISPSPKMTVTCQQLFDHAMPSLDSQYTQWLFNGEGTANHCVYIQYLFCLSQRYQYINCFCFHYLFGFNHLIAGVDTSIRKYMKSSIKYTMIYYDTL